MHQGDNISQEGGTTCTDALLFKANILFKQLFRGTHFPIFGKTIVRHQKNCDKFILMYMYQKKGNIFNVLPEK